MVRRDRLTGVGQHALLYVTLGGVFLAWSVTLLLYQLFHPGNGLWLALGLFGVAYGLILLINGARSWERRGTGASDPGGDGT